jgi:putative NIF3 family GTP cyclohydrolase 1 type 2
VNFKMAEHMGLKNVDFMAAPRVVDDVDGASGVVGELPEPMEAQAFVEMLKERYDAESVRCNGLLKRPVRRVALCGGAGSFLLGDALKAGADAFVTGEMGYHEFFGHEGQIQIAVIGHYESEQFTREIFRDIIGRECPGVRCVLAETNTNPIKYL